MEIGRGISIAAISVAIISIFIPIYGIYLVIIGTVLACASALYGERPLTIGATLINLINILFLSPSLYIFLKVQRLADGNSTALFWTIVVLLLCLPFFSILLHANKVIAIPQPATATGTKLSQRPANTQNATGHIAVDSRSVSHQGWLLSAILPSGKTVQHHVQPGAHPLTIGRSSEKADLVLEDDTISRLHARLEVREHALWISDLNSLNGTKVADQNVGVDPVRVESGNRIQLGAVRLSISLL